ncbi:MAG: type I 3-dehydroquinate dehydratase [Verrucomicrobia bacterium]|nr:type I 3-dehydroquinate dehydratase [Verrucomicrobiota bacterium]
MTTKTHGPLIVAVIASPRDVAEASKLPADSFDLCELRIDLLQTVPGGLESLKSGLPYRKIATVRDPREGGAGGLSEAARIELFEQFLTQCDLIDVELRNLSIYSTLVQQAESEGKQVILSVHDFLKTPQLNELQSMLECSALGNTRLFKAATNVASWADVEVLIELIRRNLPGRVAAMGMGAFGKLSRLVLGRLGSALVYGSVSHAVAPGQWPVAELARILSEI